MNKVELQAQYESIQNTIRSQFEEIEQLTNDQGDNKDLIIEKLVVQNQYIYNQYIKLFEKSLTIDDIAHLIDLSSRDEMEIKQYVQDQVRQAFEEKKVLEQQLGSLNMELYKYKEKCLQYDQMNDKNIYKKQLDEIINSYYEYRNHTLTQYLSYKEINQVNFKFALMNDLQTLISMIDDSGQQHQLATFQGMQETETFQNIAQQQIQLSQNIARSESAKSYEKLLKEPLSKKSSQILIGNQNDKSVNISAILRANKIEIENELRMKLSKLHKQKPNEYDFDDDLLINEVLMEKERTKKEETGLKTIIKHSIQRINALIDELNGQSNQNQPIINSLRDELTDLNSRVYVLKQFSSDEECEKWSKVVKNVQKNYEDKFKESCQENEQKEQDIQKLRQFIIDYEQQVDNMKKFIEEIESSVQDKEDMLTEMNSRIQQLQFQLEDESSFYQQQIEEKNAQVLKLTSQLQQANNLKNELLSQNSSFKEEVTKIEDQLNEMIKSKKEYEEGLDKEKEETYIQYNKLRVEYENEAEKFLIKIQDYELQIDVYKKQVQLKETEMDEMQATFNQLEAFSKRQLDVIKDQQEQIVRYKRVKEKNREYKQMIDGSNEDIQNLKADFSKLINQTQLLQRELELKNEEKIKDKEKVQFLKMRNDGYEKRIEVLERRNDELEGVVIQKEKQQVPDQTYFQSKISVLEDEKIFLVKENSTLIEQKKELANKSNVLLQSIDQLQDQIEKSVDLNTQLANERDLLQDKLFKLSDLVTLNREKLQKQEQQIQHYQSTFDNFKNTSQTQKLNTFMEADNELSSNSVFNNMNHYSAPQQQQNQYANIQRSITLHQDPKGDDIIVQQEYQANSIPQGQLQQNFEYQPPIQFTQSNSNSKYQKISMFSQPFYNDNENNIQSSNFSNNQSDNWHHNKADQNIKYSFSAVYPQSQPQHPQRQEIQIQQQQDNPYSNIQTMRGNQDDIVQNNLTYSKSNLSYSPFTLKNEVLNSEDTYLNSNQMQIKTPTENMSQNNQQQSIKIDSFNRGFYQQNQQNHQQFNSDNGTISSSRHRASLDEDMKRLNNLHSAIFDKKQQNSTK